MESGFLLINKPQGPTSHDIIDQLRRITGVQTIGHAGTLDPFADGLLIVGVGRAATRRLDEFKNLDKTYTALLNLGATSDTYDRTGKITAYIPSVAIPNVSEESSEALKGATVQPESFSINHDDIKNILLRFEGPLLQVPPMYSAKKVNGKKLYELAREGKTIERMPVWVIIHYVKLLSVAGCPLRRNSSEGSQLSVEVRCSSGTYIRSLANDIGKELGYGAYLESLTRTAIGHYSLRHAVTLDTLTSDNWQQYTQRETNVLQQTTYNKRQEASGSSVIGHRSSVLVFGTFDGLHPGHINFFEQAKKIPLQSSTLNSTHALMVGIARDSIVETIKGNKPRLDEIERLRTVRACPLVDEAYLLPENPDLRFEWIKRIHPDIIVLGYDQTAFVDDLESGLRKINCHPKIFRVKPFKPEKYKSSLLASS